MGKLKKTDYTIQKGIEPIEFVRGVQIDGRSQNLTVLLKCNNKKGIFSIHYEMGWNQITDDDQLDIGTIEVLSDLVFEARAYGKLWRQEWLRANPEKGDPDQMEIGFGDGEED